MSGEHARLMTVDDQLVVQDLGSTNGVTTPYGELRLGMRRALHPGDVIGLGRTVIEVLGRQKDWLENQPRAIEIELASAPSPNGAPFNRELTIGGALTEEELVPPPAAPARRLLDVAGHLNAAGHGDSTLMTPRGSSFEGDEARNLRRTRLTFVSRSARGVVDVEELPFRIGRLPGDEVALVVRHERISNPHLEFREHEGALSVTDLGSMNGTWVDGKRLTPHVPEPLGLHAVVRMASIPVLFTSVTGAAMNSTLWTEAAHLLVDEGLLQLADIERAMACVTPSRHLGELLLVDPKSSLTIERWCHAVDRVRAMREQGAAAQLNGRTGGGWRATWRRLARRVRGA